MEKIYTIKLNNGSFYQARGADELSLERNDVCIIRKEFYHDWGTITKIGVELEPGKGVDLPVILNKASAEELDAIGTNAAREKSAMRAAHDMIGQLKLDMKLLNAHYSLDTKYLLLQFTADGRVDFRELVKELSRALNTRIELRQIGVRDESAIHGGISVCGQVLCCCRFLKEFNSINVKMAKEQDLSLTPATISGVCGRLKCCLKYEHEGYLELEKTMPRRGEWCECAEGRGRICDRNLLTQEVTVQLESGNQIRCPRAEIQLVASERKPNPSQSGGKNEQSRKNDRRKNNDQRNDQVRRNDRQSGNYPANDTREKNNQPGPETSGGNQSGAGGNGDKNN